MNFNFAELQQKADRVLFNADQFVRRYIDFALAPAGDVVIQYYDQNGNLQTFTVPNRQKLVNQLYVDLPNSMVRTFYVDQVNGNDNNSGTQQQPFKSLYKAVNSVPAGGVGIIHLLSDYTLDDNIYIRYKTIRLFLNGRTLTTTYYIDTIHNHANKYAISLEGVNLEFVFPGRIVVPPAPSGVPLFDGTYALIGSRYYFNSVLFFIHHNHGQPNEYVFIDVRSGALVGYNQADNSVLSFTHVGFYAHYNVTAIVENGAFLVQAFGRPFSIGLFFFNNTFGGFLKRPNGTIINNFADVIAGIIRDNAGVPRNIISNRVL